MSLVKGNTKPNSGSFKKGVVANPKGRGKGVKDRRTLAREALLRAGVDPKSLTGIMPLDYMLQTLRDPKNSSRLDKQWAAEKAAPYCHRKMPIAIEGGDKPLVFLDAAKMAQMGPQELAALAAVLDKVAPGDD